MGLLGGIAACVQSSPQGGDSGLIPPACYGDCELPAAHPPLDAGEDDAGHATRDAGLRDAGVESDDAGQASGRDAQVKEEDASLRPDCCVRQPVTWERNGGLGFHGLQRLGECTRYDHERDRTCDSTLPECGDSMEIDPADVQAAIDHPDVQAALAQSPVFYGTDPRFVDGDILRVEIGGTLIEIGNDCPDPDVFPGCRDIPAGVAALATLLTQLKLQQDLRGSCAGPDLCRLPFELSPCMGRMAGLYYFSTETGSCEQLPYGKCMSNANVFETQWECRATCGVGPCVYGTPLNPDDPCVGAVVGAGRCFEDAHAACTCECYTAGASVSACAVLEQVPAYATCE